MDALQQLSEALSDRYEIEREIGAGGMANVYLAHDVRHHRRVALKVLKPELGAVLGVERFLAEIRVTANLQHPNLLPLFDSGEAGGLLYYVMPFVDGESLRGRLEREKQLPIDEAVRLATAIAGALDYAHRHGVIHRDLKPENILLQEGQPLVTDFGIALAVSNAGGGRITQTGLSLGTPQYMSPEQATGDRTIDGRTDIYSLGAMLYEMLAGDPPYHASTSQAIIAKVITEKVPDVRIARPSVPDNVADAIQGALEKLPADRWSTAAQFSDALQGKALVRRLPSARTTIASYTPLPAVRPIWVLLGLFILGALAGALGWAVSHRPVEPPTVRFEMKLPSSAVLTGGFGPTLALTPDGQSIIYVARGTAGTVLVRRRMSDLLPQPIQGTDSGAHPVVSPDGKWLAFMTSTAIKRVPIDGGVATLIAAASRPDGMSWGRGDLLLVGSTQAYPGLQRVSVRGGTLLPVTKIDSAGGEFEQRWPLMLEDGKTILYTSWKTDLSNARIGIATLDGKSAALDLAGVYPFGYVDGHLVYARQDGAIVAVPVNLRKREITGDPVTLASGLLIGGRGPAKAAVANTGTMVYETGQGGSRLQITDSLGRQESVVAESGPLAFWIEPRFSPDGKKIVVTTFNGGTSDVWIYDLQNKTRLRLTTSDTANSDYGTWSPDGKRIIYRWTDRKSMNRPTELWSLSADGSGVPTVVQKLDPKKARSVLGTYTPDGTGLLYRTAPSPSSATLWFRPLLGDTTSRMLMNATETGTAPGISPDGHWLVYSSKESGTVEVYVTHFPDVGARWPITSGGGTAPTWAPKGGAVYYANGNQIMKATLDMKSSVTVLDRIPVFTVVNSLARPNREYDISPDGKHFLFAVPQDSSNSVIAVLNWKNALKNKSVSRENSN
jgi:Serine/threonine protein kinase